MSAVAAIGVTLPPHVQRCWTWHLAATYDLRHMTGDPAFHFPPDVLAAVKDAIPLVTRSKRDVLLFFEGCGVDGAILKPIRDQLAGDSTISKHRIAEDVLVEL